MIDIGTQNAAAIQIYFGDSVEDRRNLTILGGTDKNNLAPIAKLGVRPPSSVIPYTVILNDSQMDYRYFAIEKEKDTLRGGVNVNGNIRVF